MPRPQSLPCRHRNIGGVLSGGLLNPGAGVGEALAGVAGTVRPSWRLEGGIGNGAVDLGGVVKVLDGLRTIALG
jgi:hypothetical protein